MRLSYSVFLAVRAELDVEISPSLGQQREVVAVRPALDAQITDQHIIHTLQPNGIELEHAGNVVAGFIDAGVAHNHQHPFGPGVHQADLGFQDGDAGAFAAHQRARHVEAAVLARDELVEVIARYAPRDVGIALAHQAPVLVAQRFQPGVDFAGSAALANDIEHLGVIHPADRHAGAVIEQHMHALDVVHRLAGHLSVNAAGIVAQHAAEHAVRVRGGIGPPGEAVAPRGVAQVVADQAGLDAGVAVARIDFEDLVQVLGPVNHDGGVAALSGEAGAAATGEQGRAEAATNSDGFNHILDASGDDNTDRHLAVVGAVHGVHSPRAGVEAHFSFDHTAQLALEPRNIHLRVAPVGRAPLNGPLEVFGRDQGKFVGGHVNLISGAAGPRPPGRGQPGLHEFRVVEAAIHAA